MQDVTKTQMVKQVIVGNVLDLVGNTPMVRVNHLNPNPNLEMLLKLEKFNPGGSVKDRISKYMIEQAEKGGQLRKGITVAHARANTETRRNHSNRLCIRLFQLSQKSG